MPDYATDNNWHRGPVLTHTAVQAIMIYKGDTMTREGIRKAEQRALKKIRAEWERLEADARKREECNG